MSQSISAFDGNYLRLGQVAALLAEERPQCAFEDVMDLLKRSVFAGKSVRDIAERAAIDPAMVIRYFGSKDALFAEAAVFDLKLPELSRIDQATIGKNLVRHFLALWEGENASGGLPILLRSAASNEYAANKLWELFAAQVMPAVARAGSCATAPERAGLVASQLLGIALCRYVLNLPPVVAIPQSTIVREVGRTIQRYATGT